MSLFKGLNQAWVQKKGSYMKNKLKKSFSTVVFILKTGERSRPNKQEEVDFMF